MPSWIVAPLALLRLSLKLSKVETSVLLINSTRTVLVVSPARNFSVPLTPSKSLPLSAVQLAVA